MGGRFLEPLQLEYIDGRKWKVLKAFEYLTQQSELVVVPVGFVTDFASIPKVLWNVLPPTGSYGKAAVVHDLLYRTAVVRVTTSIGSTYDRAIDRARADAIFLEAMQTLGVGWFTRSTIYSGVRVGG
jgi:hypothetical protein